MEISSQIQTIFGLFVMLATYTILKIASKTKKAYTKRIEIPEPAGALPFIGHLHLLGSQIPAAQSLGAIADKFGSFFSLKIGFHRFIVVSSWEMAKEFLATNDRTFATRASIAAGKYMGYNNAVLALAPYGQYWRDVRKMATLELLSSHRLEKLKHVRFSEVESLIKDSHLLSTNNKVVTISKLFEHMTFNISLRMIVGKRFSATTYGEKRSEACRFHSAIKDALYLAGVFVLSDAIPYLEWMDYQGHIGFMKRTAKELDSVLEIWLNEHLQKQLEQKSDGESDFMDVMLSSFAEDAEISGHTRATIVKANALVCCHYQFLLKYYFSSKNLQTSGLLVLYQTVKNVTLSYFFTFSFSIVQNPLNQTQHYYLI